MLKGKSVIELRNAETGKIEQVVKDENMVTNAVSNLANPPEITKYISGASSVNIPGCITPLIDNCFSALMLFEERITEDVNNIIPNISKITNVGKAVDAYTGSDPLRGSLNTAETKNLENGKRYVWDFPTDKSNGTIRSVALTNYHRGFHGFKFSAHPIIQQLSASIRGPVCKSYTAVGNAFLQDSVDNSGMGSPILATSSIGFSPAGMYKDKEVLFYKAGKASKNCIFETYTLEYSKLTLKTKTSVQKKQITKSSNVEFSDVFSSDDNYVYSFYATSKNTVSFIKIDAITLNIIKSEYITVQDMDLVGAGSVRGIEYNGYYYIMKPNSVGGDSIKGVYKIKIDDLSNYSYIPINTILCLPETTTTQFNRFVFCVMSGALLITPIWEASRGSWETDLQSYLPQYAFVIKENLAFFPIAWRYYYANSSYPNGYVYRILPSPIIKDPYFLITNGDQYTTNYSNEVRFGINSMFLSTINNLTTPVVKNETQTMKVTYEITEV